MWEVGERAFLCPQLLRALLTMQKSRWKSRAAVLPCPTVWPKVGTGLSQARQESLCLYFRTLKDFILGVF